MADPVLLDVGLNWSGLDSQIDQMGAKLKAAIASISAPAPANSIFDESKIAKMGDAFEKAASRKEASTEKAAQAAERAAEREAAASAKAAAELIKNAERAEAAKVEAARQAEAALDKAVNAELRAAEKEINAQNRAAANAQKAAAQKQQAEERFAQSLNKTVEAGNRAEMELRKLAAITPGQKAAADFEATSARIKKLGEDAGNTVLAEKALEAEQQRLAQSLAQQAKGGDAAAGGYNRANAGAMNLFHQLKDMAAGLASGQNPMQILAQQGPQVADAFEMGGGAAATLGSALTSLMGPVGFVVVGLGEVAIAATALYGVYASLNEQQTINNEVVSAQSAAYERLNPLLEDTRDTEIDLAEKTGVLTKEMAGYERAIIGAFGQYNAAVEETKKQLAELQAAQASITTQMVDSAESWVPAWTPLGMAIRGLTNDTADYQQKIDGANQSMKVAADALQENKDRHFELAAAEQKEREGKERQTKERKSHTSALHDEEQRLKEMAAAYEKLDEVQAKATRSANQLDWGLKEGAKTATEAKNAYDAEITLIERQSEVLLKAAKNPAEIAKINAEVLQAQQAAMAEYGAQSHAIMQANLDAITYLGAEGVLKAKKQWEQRINDLRILQASGVLSERDANQQKLEITADYERQLETIYGTAYQKLDKQRQDDVKKEQDAARKKREMAYGYVGQIGDTLGMIDGLIGNSNAKQKQAHKDLAVAQLLISGAIAIGKDMELGWPAMIPAMAFTTVQTGLQIAAVESAHQGRVLVRHQGGGVDYPDELRILRSEIGGVLNSQATRRLGEQGVAAINGGASPAVSVRMKVGRVESNEITRIDTLTDGPISSRFRTERARTTLDSGFRGRMAPA